MEFKIKIMKMFLIIAVIEIYMIINMIKVI